VLNDEVRAVIEASSLAPLSPVVVRQLLVAATTRLIPGRQGLSAAPRQVGGD
jgi:hypothetical protein